MSGGDGSLFLCCVKTWNGMGWDRIGWDGRFGLAVIGSTIKVLQPPLPPP